MQKTCSHYEDNAIINKSIKPTKEEIVETLKKFKGEVMQKPPIFSAIKVAGKNSYLLARKGQQPHLKERPIIIKEIEIISYEYPILKIRIVTGPGVYIRALSRDIGRELKTGAYMYSLVRTRVGSFKSEDAVRVDNLSTYLQ